MIRQTFASPSAERVIMFDLDGVLVDTQDAETVALRRYGMMIGADLPNEGFYELIAGRKMKESVDIVASFAKTTPARDAVERVREIAESLLASRLRAVPGVMAALEAIRYPGYVVSNSPLVMIQDRLAATGLQRFFPASHFSAYELGIWKPDPGLYLAAVEALNANPDTVVVVEDSEVGVESARRARLRTLRYRPGHSVAHDENTSVTTFGDMRLLPALVEGNMC
jgi:HAD superfamily hydrolase (TIGR01509 family)